MHFHTINENENPWLNHITKLISLDYSNKPPPLYLQTHTTDPQTITTSDLLHSRNSFIFIMIISCIYLLSSYYKTLLLFCFIFGLWKMERRREKKIGNPVCLPVARSYQDRTNWTHQTTPSHMEEEHLGTQYIRELTSAIVRIDCFLVGHTHQDG